MKSLRRDLGQGLNPILSSRGFLFFNSFIISSYNGLPIANSVTVQVAFFIYV